MYADITVFYLYFGVIDHSTSVGYEMKIPYKQLV